MKTGLFIPYRDLSVEKGAFRDLLMAAVEKVLDHGRLILGPEVDEFEARVASMCGTRFAVGVGSGTDALYLGLKALGVGPGDEVITTPLSWIATLNAITLCGARARFVDIDTDLNMNPELIASAISPRTKAIVPVHFTGRLCKMKDILEIAKQNSLYVIEDAAQSFGAHDRDGRTAGSFGDIGCFSMNPMKVFPAYGEAGCITTNSEAIRDRLRSLRYAGTINKEDCHIPSLNGRMDTIQAAMLLVNLKFFHKKIARLRKIAHYYNETLKDVVSCPLEDDSFHVYYSYTIIVEERTELIEFLKLKGIETKIQHPILMPFHSAYKDKYANLELPVAQKLVKRILCIPNHEKLTDAEAEYIAAAILEFYGKG